MEWVIALVSTLLGAVMGTAVAYLFGVKARKSQEKAQLMGAIRSILIEVESNLKLAKQPWTGRIVGFVTQAWDVHKSHILGMPWQAQGELQQLYIEIQHANALFQLNLNLPYGLGYYNNEYKNQCGKIASEAEKANKSLFEWLKQQG